MDINEIKGGDYQLVSQRWDEPTSKPGEPFTFRRHRKGDKLTLSEADARRLVAAGAVVKPGEMERRAAEAALAQYRAAVALVPDDLREHLQEPDDIAAARAAAESPLVAAPEKSARRPAAPKD